MVRGSSQAILAVLCTLVVLPVLMPAALAASPEEERLLGCGCEEAQLQSYLPFTREIGVSGIVKGSLGSSATDAGVPPAAMVEVLKALATVTDLDRNVHDGDKLYVRYERAFTAAGAPLDVGRVLWIEVKTAAKGTLAMYRFRPSNAEHETFWMTSGRGTSAPELEMPLKSIAVTSGFGMRADPMDQPSGRRFAMGQVPARKLRSGTRWQPPVVLAPSPLLSGAAAVNQPTARGVAMGLAPGGSHHRFGGFAKGRPLEMHDGVDLAAGAGTPVYAAGDGIVVGAAPNGGYGNCIEIEHAGKLATIYGHLSAFAAGIARGIRVKQGELIGFTGSTGRSTGPHLHFEIRVDGRPTNPIGNAALKHAQLRGADLVRFRKIVAQDVAERDREAKAM
jgi:murein DD-endopeptidase MepM/ murein hydrolase activator NlpD